MANAFEIATLGRAGAARADSTGPGSVRNEPARCQNSVARARDSAGDARTVPAIELMRPSAQSSGACRTGDATLE